MSKVDDLDQLAIQKFQEYLRIPSVSGITDYEDAVKFLESYANDLQLDFKIVRVKPDRPVVLITWQGTDPSLPAILLNSHMDVVPVEEDKWTYPPFAAHIDEEGRIYGRGSQDMKCNGIQYLEALRRLQLDDIVLERTVIVLFVPDEELGGAEGMKLFVQTPEFKALKIAFALDESDSGNKPKTNTLYYTERHSWVVKFILTGREGHGSINLANTAGEKLSKLLQSIYAYRDTQLQLANGDENSANVNSLNVTMIEGGKQHNVVPSRFEVTTDIRLRPDIDIDVFQGLLESWCSNAGEGVWYEGTVCDFVDKSTPPDNSSLLFGPMMETAAELGHTIIPQISFGASDSRFLRAADIPSFGYSSLTGEILLHKHNEYITTYDFIFGITFYYKVLQKVCARK